LQEDLKERYSTYGRPAEVHTSDVARVVTMARDYMDAHRGKINMSEVMNDILYDKTSRVRLNEDQIKFIMLKTLMPRDK
jgi:hypothetical protein